MSEKKDEREIDMTCIDCGNIFKETVNGKQIVMIESDKSSCYLSQGKSGNNHAKGVLEYLNIERQISCPSCNSMNISIFYTKQQKKTGCANKV